MRAAWEPNPLLVNVVFIAAIVLIAAVAYRLVAAAAKRSDREEVQAAEVKDVEAPEEPVEVEPEEPEPIGTEQYIRGLFMYNLLVFPEWVNRRVETFELLGAGWARRRVSLDFQLPAELLGLKLEEELDAVPLTLMHKEPLLSFDIRDEEGRPLPVASAARGVALGQAMLLAVAEELLDKVPTAAVCADLRMIAGGNPALARSHLGRMQFAAAEEFPALLASVAEHIGDAETEAWDERRELMEDVFFVGLLNDLAENYLLLVDEKPSATRRRIFKFVYEHPVASGEATAARWLATRMGWTATQYGFRTPAANKARSYHCEMQAPPALEITQARLVAGQAGVLDEQRGVHGIVHLHTARQLPNHVAPARFVVSLRSARLGFLRPAVVIGGLTCALLWAGLGRLPELERGAEATSAFLVLVPGLLAAYLAQAGEHEIASSLRSGVRVSLVTSGACAITAGAMLVGGLRADILKFGWIALSILSSFCVALLLLAAFLPIVRSEPASDGRGLPL